MRLLDSGLLGRQMMYSFSCIIIHYQFANIVHLLSFLIIRLVKCSFPHHTFSLNLSIDKICALQLLHHEQTQMAAQLKLKLSCVQSQATEICPNLTPFIPNRSFTQFRKVKHMITRGGEKKKRKKKSCSSGTAEETVARAERGSRRLFLLFQRAEW